MDNIIVYLDDVDYARQLLAPMTSTSQGERTHWILVACPPRMTRHISKWVSYSARENWRAKWADKVFAQITPDMQASGDRVTCLLASSSLTDMTQDLLARQGAARVLDARRPRLGQDLPPVTANQPAPTTSKWTVPGAVAGMGAALVLAAE